MPTYKECCWDCIKCSTDRPPINEHFPSPMHQFLIYVLALITLVAAAPCSSNSECQTSLMDCSLYCDPATHLCVPNTCTPYNWPCTSYGCIDSTACSCDSVSGCCVPGATPLVSPTPTASSTATPPASLTPSASPTAASTASRSAWPTVSPAAAAPLDSEAQTMSNGDTTDDDDDLPIGTIIIVAVAGGGALLLGVFFCAFLVATMSDARRHALVQQSLKQKH